MLYNSNFFFNFSLAAAGFSADQSFFKPLKKPQPRNKILGVEELGGRAWMGAVTVKNAISGFKVLRVYPLNTNIFPDL